jgi:hypothetical protein
MSAVKLISPIEAFQSEVSTEKIMSSFAHTKSGLQINIVSVPGFENKLGELSAVRDLLIHEGFTKKE